MYAYGGRLQAALQEERQRCDRVGAKLSKKSTEALSLAGQLEIERAEVRASRAEVKFGVVGGVWLVLLLASNRLILAKQLGRPVLGKAAGEQEAWVGLIWLVKLLLGPLWVGVTRDVSVGLDLSAFLAGR
eukprot:356565-Chlamydomonas_euryale.AAC.5